MAFKSSSNAPLSSDDVMSLLNELDQLFDAHHIDYLDSFIDTPDHLGPMTVRDLKVIKVMGHSALHFESVFGCSSVALIIQDMQLQAEALALLTWAAETADMSLLKNHTHLIFQLLVSNDASRQLALQFLDKGLALPSVVSLVHRRDSIEPTGTPLHALFCDPSLSTEGLLPACQILATLYSPAIRDSEGYTVLGRINQSLTTLMLSSSQEHFMLECFHFLSSQGADASDLTPRADFICHKELLQTVGVALERQAILEASQVPNPTQKRL